MLGEIEHFPRQKIQVIAGWGNIDGPPKCHNMSEPHPAIGYQ